MAGPGELVYFVGRPRSRPGDARSRSSPSTTRSWGSWTPSVLLLFFGGRGAKRPARRSRNVKLAPVVATVVSTINAPDFEDRTLLLCDLLGPVRGARRRLRHRGRLGGRRGRRDRPPPRRRQLGPPGPGRPGGPDPHGRRRDRRRGDRRRGHAPPPPRRRRPPLPPASRPRPPGSSLTGASASPAQGRPKADQGRPRRDTPLPRIDRKARAPPACPSARPPRAPRRRA